MTYPLTLAQYKLDREETEPCIFERTRRRRMVNDFLKERDYWQLLRWLTSRARIDAALPRFFSLDEALAHFRPLRFDNDYHRASYTVAVYFSRRKWGWLDEPRYSEAAE